MSLRDKMLAVIDDVNGSVAEREELVEMIAIALLTRKNLFVLGEPGQAKSYAINLFRRHITGARQFERLLSKQSDEEQLFGRVDLSSLIPGSIPDSALENDDIYQNLRFDLKCAVDGLGQREDTPEIFAMLNRAAGKLPQGSGIAASKRTGRANCRQDPGGRARFFGRVLQVQRRRAQLAPDCAQRAQVHQ